MAVTVDSTTALAHRRRDTSSATDAQPYIDAIDLIRVAITRHREYNDSLEDSKESTQNIVEDTHRSQSPLGFTNDAQTIEEIEVILCDLDRTHPPPKLSHDSSKIDADLVSTADDNGQVVAPLPVVEAPWKASDGSMQRTHPEDFEPYDYHIHDVAIFENDLMKAFNNSQTAHPKYTKVEVLLLTWEAADDDDIREEIDVDTKELLELFKEVNYSVTSVTILRDRRRGWHRLQRELSKFVDKYEEYPNDDVLFLVHYNGHGSIRNKKSYWHPTGFAAKPSDSSDRASEQNGPTIEYDDVRKIFDSVVNQDILFVLDCCYAGAASRSKGPGNTKELLAACGSADRTPATNSFTSKFVKCFRDQLKTDTVFQVGWLFGAITDISQKPTPLHVNLNKSPTSICLSSLAVEDPNAGDLVLTGSGNNTLFPAGLGDNGNSSMQGSTKALSIFSDDKSISDETRPTSTHADAVPPDHWNYEVLITVKLLGDVLPEKRGWNLEFPSSQVQGVSAVKVRSMFSTKSTLLLVTMPVRCWVLLPDNPAYTFIDFIRSDDLLHPHDSLAQASPELSPKDISFATRTDSDKSSKTSEHVPHIIAAIKDFFENSHKHEAKEKHGPMHRITSKIGLHSSSSRFENDPRYGYVRHIMQQLVVVRNDFDESHVSYDLHFREEKKLFERCKKHLIQEVLHNAGPNNKNVLENTVSTELDQLEREVLQLVEVEKKRPKVEPKASFEHGETKAKPRSQKRKSVASHISKHEPIPEDKEVTDANHQRESSSTLPVISATQSSTSLRKLPRTDSMKSRNQGSDPRPLLGFLGRRLSRDSGRSMQSPMGSRRATGHTSFNRITAGA